MASNMRRGTIPYKTTGVGEYVDEVYSLEGFFGEWVHMYRHNNAAHPVRWSDDRLMYSGLDSGALRADDAADPAGEPMRLLEGDDTAVSMSQRRAPMPFCEKNVDRHQIRFYHRGQFTLETELGRLSAGPGDFVVIPRGLTYRESPLAGADHSSPGSARSTPGSAEDLAGCVFIFEVEAPIRLAERLWDSVGYASLFVDYSEMEVPEPVASLNATTATTTGTGTGTGTGTEHEVRVRYGGAWHTVVYDFDPCADVVGWVGDPVIFKMNAYGVPTSGTTHGHLPPPSGAVLFGEHREFFFNVLSMPPPPTVGPPDGSFGAPAHLNDYDEVWLTHSSELAPHTVGHLWLLPRTIPHPGMKRPSAPMRDGRQPQSVRINFDTHRTLRWTDRAREALFEDPLSAKYTSFFGVPLKAAPEGVRRRATAPSSSAEHEQRGDRG